VNIELLELAAAALDDLLAEVALVGGRPSRCGSRTAAI
jgi:hypothetical protein